jgi:hypothetical protein
MVSRRHERRLRTSCPGPLEGVGARRTGDTFDTVFADAVAEAVEGGPEPRAWRLALNDTSLAGSAHASAASVGGAGWRRRRMEPSGCGKHGANASCSAA